MPESQDFMDLDAIAAKIGEGAEEAASAPAETETIAEQPAPEAPPAPPAPPATPVKFKVKVDGEEVEFSRKDIADQFERLLGGDKDDLTKVASFTGYLNKKSQAISKDREAWEARKLKERQGVAEEFLQEYIRGNHGERAPEIIRAIGCILNGEDVTPATAQAASKPENSAKFPEGVDPNDPLAVAHAQTQAELSSLKTQQMKMLRQIEEMAKASREARSSYYQAQVRAEYEGAIKAHPILQDDLFADAAKAKVYALVKDGGLSMADATSRVAKEIEERNNAAIERYVAAKKQAAKSGATQPPAAAPALAPKKKFSFSGDPDEMDAMIAEKFEQE